MLFQPLEVLRDAAGYVSCFEQIVKQLDKKWVKDYETLCKSAESMMANDGEKISELLNFPPHFPDDGKGITEDKLYSVKDIMLKLKEFGEFVSELIGFVFYKLYFFNCSDSSNGVPENRNGH